MKCSLDQFSKIFKIFLLRSLLTISVFNFECASASESREGSDMLRDFDYLVSQLYLQHCTFIEIGEGLCSMFVELTLDKGCDKPLRKQMFFGNCLCSEFRKWHLCSYPLTRVRPEDCEFQGATSCPSSSARVHRRVCDITGMSQWNSQCNCSVALAGTKQEHMCGFKTCYASPMPKSICGPRTVCGTAHCDVGEHGSLYSVRCDRKCRYHQPFCEDPGPATSLRRSVTSEWGEWRSVSSPGSECNMQQFETECLDQNKEPAFDCLGPGLLCCGKEESDCTCEVKMQDGKLKAFRYMIKFGDTRDHCDTNNSKLKVRSTGIKGDAKVWNRFIGTASREDKSDSISMFGKPLGLDAEQSKFRPEKNEATYEIVRASLENPGKPKDGILEQLVMLISSNRSQVDRSKAKLNISDSKEIDGKSLQVESGNSSLKFLNVDSQRIPVNQTLDSVKSGPLDDKQVNSSMNQQQNQTLDSVKSGPLDGKQPVHSNVNHLQTMSNNSKSNLNPNLLQKDAQQTDKMSNEKIQYHVTPLPYINITNKAEILEYNNSNTQIIAEMLRNASNDVDEKSTGDAKMSDGEDSTRKTLKTNIINEEHQNNKSVEKLGNNNQQKESAKTMSNSYTGITNMSSVNKVAANMELIPDNQKILLDKSMITTIKNSSLNENTENKIENSLQPLETNAQSQQNMSKTQNKEAGNNEKKLARISFNKNHQHVLTEQENVKDNNKLEEISNDKEHGEGTLPETNNQGIKIENESKENHNSMEWKNVDGTISEENGRYDRAKAAVQNSHEKDRKDGHKMNTDINKENKLHVKEKTIDLARDQEFPLARFLISENKPKGQENSSVDEEDKAELEGNEQHQVIASVQGNQTNNKTENKKIEHSVTSKLVNQEVTTIQNVATKLSTKPNIPTERTVTNLPQQKIVGKEITKSSSVVMSYKPTATLGQTKQLSISNLFNSVKLSTMSSQPNAISMVKDKSIERKATEQKPQKSVVNETANTVHIQQQNTSSSTISSPNKAQSIKEQTLNKKIKVNEIANLLPNYTPRAMTAVSSKRRPRPYFLDENEENGIKLNIQTMATPDLLGSIAKKLFHSNGNLNDPNDPFRMLSDSNPSISVPEEKSTHDYDEPEPVLKDLNKVDRESVDEKMAEALSKIADINGLPGNIEWSENSIDHDNKLSFEIEKNLDNKENVNLSGTMATLSARDVKKKRMKCKFKTN